MYRWNYGSCKQHHKLQAHSPVLAKRAWTSHKTEPTTKMEWNILHSWEIILAMQTAGMNLHKEPHCNAIQYNVILL